MSMTRRNFLLSTGWAAVAGAAVPTTGFSANLATTTFKPDDWRSVRTQFNLSPDYVHLAGFYIVSHPRPVREAIERYRKAIDENPFLTVDRGMFGKPEDRM